MIGAIISWLVVGLVAGFLANLVMRGGHGLVMDLILGLVGAIIGGFIVGAILGFHAHSLIAHIVVAFVGAIILTAAVRLVEHRSVFA